MPALQAIVFDLDDTLYAERDYVASGFRAVATWAGQCLDVPIEETFQQLTTLFDQDVRGNIFDCWTEDRGIPRNCVPEMVAVYREHHPDISPFPEVLGLLRRLRNSYRLGIVTDGRADVQERKLAAVGVAQYFDSIVLSDRLGRDAWKPSTRPFEQVLKGLDISTGGDAIYVGDNPAKDFLGAKQIGMWTVRLKRTDGVYAALEPSTDEYAPHYEIRNLNEIESTLERIGMFSASIV